MNKVNIRKDDLIVILSGKDKGEQGRVLEVMPRSNKMVVERVSIVSRHAKSRKQSEQSGILKEGAPICTYEVQRVYLKYNEPTRPVHKLLGGDEKVRVYKKYGAEI